MSVTPPTGPPTGPISGPPAFGPSPSLEPEPPARSTWPVVGGVLLGVALVLGGIGIGFVLFGGDDDDEPAAPPTTVDDTASTEDPFGDLSDLSDLPDLSDLTDLSDIFEGDLSDLLPEDFEEDFSDLLPDDLEGLLPEDFDELDEFLDDPPFGPGSVQAAAVFSPDATAAEVSRVEQAWEDEPLLSGVILVTAEDLEDLADGSLPESVPSVLSGFGSEGDADAVRDFVCSFADDPGVQSVQVLGARPCDQIR